MAGQWNNWVLIAIVVNFSIAVFNLACLDNWLASSVTGARVAGVIDSQDSGKKCAPPRNNRRILEPP